MLTCCHVFFSMSLSSKSAAIRYSLSSIIVCIHSPSIHVNACSGFRKRALLTPVKNKAVHSYLFIAMDTNFVNERLIAKCADCRHEPTITICSLSYVIGTCSILIELGFLENLLFSISSLEMPQALTESYRDSLDGFGKEFIFTGHKSA